MSKANTTKEVKVTIKRSNKLTIAEITALASTIYNEANDAIRKHNNTYKDSLQYKTEEKAIRTKHGVLKAEKALIAFQLKHPKVELTIYSKECDQELSQLSRKYQKSLLSNWSGESDMSRIKNKLIVAQIDPNANMLTIIENIKSELIG